MQGPIINVPNIYFLGGPRIPTHPKWDEGSHKGEGDIFTANGPDVIVLADCQGHTETLHLSLATPPSSGDAKIRERAASTLSALRSPISIIKACIVGISEVGRTQSGLCRPLLTYVLPTLAAAAINAESVSCMDHERRSYLKHPLLARLFLPSTFVSRLFPQLCRLVAIFNLHFG